MLYLFRWSPPLGHAFPSGSRPLTGDDHSMFARSATYDNAFDASTGSVQWCGGEELNLPYGENG